MGGPGTRALAWIPHTYPARSPQAPALSSRWLSYLVDVDWPSCKRLGTGRGESGRLFWMM